MRHTAAKSYSREGCIMSVIEAKNLSYVYSLKTPFEKKALDCVNFSINSGEFIGIAGQTGSGKSTLVQHLNGLIKPTSGKVLFNGEDLTVDKQKLRLLRFKVGLVFQFPEYQLFDETVYKDISFGPKNMGLSEDEIKQKVLSAAEFVGLDLNLLDKSPFELSGGEKRKAAIAGVIAMDPEVLILDEPTAGLDPSGKEHLMRQIKAYHHYRKNTVIVISHNMDELAKNCDRIMVMSNGKILAFDQTKKIFSNLSVLKKASLKVPTITQIMLNLKETCPEVSEGILSIDEAYNEIMKIISKKETLNVK